MGTLVGHVAPGFGFFVIGLWHLLNHIKLHALNPNNYKSLPWFPTSKSRYAELLLIMVGCSMSIAMELFIGPRKHQPLDSDGSIPSNHLHNFEHSSISLTFLVYAAFAIVLDRIDPPKSKYGLTQLLGAIAFAQQLLLFHLHSADHMGVEGQYHVLLQILILVSLITTLMGTSQPKSFLISFVRSLSILFQGVWLMVMGFMLWTPAFIPKGCYLNLEEGHKVVRCHADESLHRAKSLVNIQFSWYLILVTICGMCSYLYSIKIYTPKVEYHTLFEHQEELVDEEDEDEDVEAQKKSKLGQTSERFVHMGKAYPAMDIER